MILDGLTIKMIFKKEIEEKRLPRCSILLWIYSPCTCIRMPFFFKAMTACKDF